MKASELPRPSHYNDTDSAYVYIYIPFLLDRLRHLSNRDSDRAHAEGGPYFNRGKQSIESNTVEDTGSQQNTRATQHSRYSVFFHRKQPSPRCEGSSFRSAIKGQFESIDFGLVI